MKRILSILVAAVISGNSLASSPTPEASGHGAPAEKQHASTSVGGHWDYKGPNGPENWANLSPSYSACRNGREQSPVNITSSYPQDLNKLEFSYGMSKINIVNNGHTIQVNYDPGSFLRIGDEKYELIQFHFHTPSEEMINSKQYSMVAHLVHKNEEGRLAVIAVLFDKAAKDNDVINNLWSRMPKEEKESRIYEESHISAASLLPLNLGYYTFNGSLTTPPCSEGVRWIVLKTPVPISVKQLDKFKEEFPMNARPIQPMFGRNVFESM